MTVTGWPTKPKIFSTWTFADPCLTWSDIWDQSTHRQSGVFWAALGRYNPEKKFFDAPDSTISSLLCWVNDCPFEISSFKMLTSSVRLALHINQLIKVEPTYSSNVTLNPVFLITFKRSPRKTSCSSPCLPFIFSSSCDHHLAPHVSPCWIACNSSSLPCCFLPQCPCTGFSLCLEWAFPAFPPGRLRVTFSGSAAGLPSVWGAFKYPSLHLT